MIFSVFFLMKTTKIDYNMVVADEADRDVYHHFINSLD